MHGDVSKGHDHNVNGLRMLNQIHERVPGIRKPELDSSARTVGRATSSSHDPHLGFLLFLFRGRVGDFLHSLQELRNLLEGHSVRQRRIGGELREQVRGIGDRFGGDIGGNRDIISCGSSGSRVGSRIREDQGGQGQVLGGGLLGLQFHGVSTFVRGVGARN